MAPPPWARRATSTRRGSPASARPLRLLESRRGKAAPSLRSIVRSGFRRDRCVLGSSQRWGRAPGSTGHEGHPRHGPLGRGITDVRTGADEPRCGDRRGVSTSGAAPTDRHDRRALLTRCRTGESSPPLPPRRASAYTTPVPSRRRSGGREWVGGRYLAPGYVVENGARIRCDVAIWMLQPEGMIVATQVGASPMPPDAVVEALLEKLGPPPPGALAERVRVADPAIAEALRHSVVPRSAARRCAAARSASSMSTVVRMPSSRTEHA